MATAQQWLASMIGARKVDDSGDDNSALPSSKPQLSVQQRAGVERGAQVVGRFGGVLLADAVGLGKTRMAVAMARRIGRDVRRRSGHREAVLFAVPARLRDNWEQAIGAVGWQLERDARIISHHRLSRRPVEGRPPVVVVDEAHRFRNPDAKRSRHLAQLTARTPPILVTATPVCTRPADLKQLLSYFLVDSVVKSMVGMGLDATFEAFEAGEFDIVEILQEVVIRRRSPDFGASGRPSVRFEMLRYRASDDERWLWQNLESSLRSLHLAAVGEYWPRGLLINNLMRMWESGPASLAESLDELLHYHERWLDAVAAGRRIERPEFRRLFGDVDRNQQVFSFGYGEYRGETPGDERCGDVRRDYRSLGQLRERLAGLQGMKAAMIEAMADLVESKADEKFLIFAAYRAAAEAIFSTLADLRATIRVGLITGDGARATGLGATTAGEVMDRFYADGRSTRPRRESLRILVGTDCIAEGVNLDGCSNLVLADLPYSPVKLEQRIGRIARPGSDVEQVTVYLPRPQSWTDSLGMRRRLSERIDSADSLGLGHTLLDAGDVGASSAASESGADSDDAGPLAAMTGEHRLRQRLSTAEAGEPPTMARCRSEPLDEEAALWVRIEIRAASTRRVWLCMRSGDRAPVTRLSEQLPGLARLADRRVEIDRWRPEGALWKRVEDWIERRRSQLEAARLAPPLLGSGSAPCAIWRRLKSAVSKQRLDADGQRLDDWRRRLLQAHPPGIHWEMEALLDGEPSIESMVNFVEGLETPRERDETQIDVVGALLV